MSDDSIHLPPEGMPSRDEGAFLLGLYITRWGDVETAIEGLIRKLLDTDIISAQIVLRALGDMRTQREIASELGKHRLYNSDFVKLEKLLDRLKAATTRRNRIVHGKWMLVLEVGNPPNPKPLTAENLTQKP